MANEHIEVAGDYNLASIVLHNHQNQGVVKMNSSVSNNTRYLQYRTTISRTTPNRPEIYSRIYELT